MVDHEIRLVRAEKCLVAAMQQIKVDAELLYEGEPHEKTTAEYMWEEYQRIYGIGRKP